MLLMSLLMLLLWLMLAIVAVASSSHSSSVVFKSSLEHSLILRASLHVKETHGNPLSGNPWKIKTSLIFFWTVPCHGFRHRAERGEPDRMHICTLSTKVIAAQQWLASTPTRHTLCKSHLLEQHKHMLTTQYVTCQVFEVEVCQLDTTITLP